MKILPWKVLSSKKVFDAMPHFSIDSEKVETSAGKVLEPFYRFNMKDFVVVVPLLSDDRVVMVEQYRNGLRTVSLELPAGSVDLGEPPLMAAIRELEEETGYHSSSVSTVGKPMSANPALNSNRYSVFLARNLTPGPQKLDHGEEIIVRSLPLNQAIEMALSGEIVHSPTVVGLVRAAYLLGELTFAA